MAQLRIVTAFFAGLVLFLSLVRTATAVPASGLRRSIDFTRDSANDVCRPEDRTYSTQVMKAGSYMPWTEIPIHDNRLPSTQYVTIVNLTPHRFVLDRSRTHSYQMDQFDWDDIPQGKSRQNTAEDTSNPFKKLADTAGEAYYSIDGTSKTFVIRKRFTGLTDSYPHRTIIDLTGMGLGQREYLDPGRKTAVTLVITGSETYGFQASLRHGQGNWMKGIYDVIKDREIRHVILPGSHDAGMSKITNAIKSPGTQPNTQTQGLGIYDQLRAGSRYFDLRVSSVHEMTGSDYKFWTMHVSEEAAQVVIGNTGQSLDDVIYDINAFTSESPGEIIIFRVRYLIGMREIPVTGPIYWDSTIMNNFFNSLKGVNNRCPNLDGGFETQTASYFMDQNDGRGCVLFLLVDDNLKPDVPHESPADGIYHSSKLNVQNTWSNQDQTEGLANDQVAKWKAVNRTGDLSGSTYLIGQWMISINPVSSTLLSLQNIAILPTDPAIYWMGVNNMSPEAFPTVLWLDYIGIVVTDQISWDQTSAEMYTWAVGMNLYMVSENCDISKHRSPLLPGAVSKRGTDAEQWNGIIYANGTVVDSPAQDVHPGRADTLQPGTMFANGTVLDTAMPNPNSLTA